MNSTEHQKALGELKKKHRRDTRDLAEKFARANSAVRIGDIVTDHMGSIRVETTRVFGGVSTLPQMVYCGVRVTKKGSDFKSGEQRNVYQANMKHCTE